MARKGRPRKTNAQKLADALKRVEPPAYIAERRKLFSFVQPPADKRQDGRNGEIDSEIADPIGQLCALGLLDGHGHDPVEMRDKGRFWGCHLVELMKRLGCKTASFDRTDRSVKATAMTGADLLFDKMDEALPPYERRVLWDLIVTPLLGQAYLDREAPPWAQGFIDEALIARGRVPRGVVRFPDSHDRSRLEAAIRGLVVLVDGSLPNRWAA